jgi:carbonic anhydrase
MRSGICGVAIVLAVVVMVALGARRAQSAGGTACNDARPLSPAAALQALLDGNARWTAGTSKHPGQDAARRGCVSTNGQTPFAAILSCSDSRVPPELVFDQGVGDLFVVRVAGNTADTVGVESLGYAVDNLGAEIVLVLGHQQCGAVNAAWDSYPKPAPKFVTAIYDAVAKVKKLEPGAGQDVSVNGAIDQNVILEVEKLRKTHPFDEKIAAGKLRIIGGRYDLDSGKVTLLIQ